MMEERFEVFEYRGKNMSYDTRTDDLCEVWCDS